MENPNVENRLKGIVDYGSFQFERPMQTGKKDIRTAMFRISITDKDINASKGEALLEGGYYVCVLQMILTEETPKEGSESPIRVIGTGGDGKLGKELGGISN